jgi:hypothetical protein
LNEDVKFLEQKMRVHGGSSTEVLSAGDILAFGFGKEEDDYFDLPPHDVWKAYMEDKNVI